MRFTHGLMNQFTKDMLTARKAKTRSSGSKGAQILYREAYSVFTGCVRCHGDPEEWGIGKLKVT